MAPRIPIVQQVETSVSGLAASLKLLIQGPVPEIFYVILGDFVFHYVGHY